MEYMCKFCGIVSNEEQWMKSHESTCVNSCNECHKRITDLEEAHTWLDSQKVPRSRVVLGKENKLSLVGRIRALIQQENGRCTYKFLHEIEALQSSLLVHHATMKSSIIDEVQQTREGLRHE